MIPKTVSAVRNHLCPFAVYEVTYSLALTTMGTLLPWGFPCR